MHGKDSQSFCNSLPIMLTLCLMLLGTYYAKNCAGIIGQSLFISLIILLYIINNNVPS